jgi:hypothetical protein
VLDLVKVELARAPKVDSQHERHHGHAPKHALENKRFESESGAGLVLT